MDSAFSGAMMSAQFIDKSTLENYRAKRFY
jgi:hypothetical protein